MLPLPFCLCEASSLRGKSITGYHLSPTRGNVLSLAEGQIRKYATPAEKALWRSLRSKQLLGYKFRRQHPLHQYITDFYCHELKLIIEVDGPIHQHQLTRDAQRDLQLRLHSYTVLRFTNKEILTDINVGLEKVKTHIITNLSPMRGNAE